MAIAVGAVAACALAVVVALALRGASGPGEDVAVAYLEAFYAGEGVAAYGLLAPTTRTVVFERELDRLAGLAADLVGGEVDLRIVGSEQGPGASLVGYRGRAAIGPLEGVVALALVDGSWRVLEASYRFPEATSREVAAFQAEVDSLNSQIRSRLGS